MSIFKFIQKRGFTGRYTIVHEFCRSFKQTEAHKATVRENTRQDFNFLAEAFKYTGSVPREIWFDNMATIVDWNGSSFIQTKFNSRFLSYANDATFKRITYRLFRPQTKDLSKL